MPLRTEPLQQVNLLLLSFQEDFQKLSKKLVDSAPQDGVKNQKAEGGKAYTEFREPFQKPAGRWCDYQGAR